MSSEEKQYDQRLESVLDFLSKEIAATSGPVQGQESQAEDIDSVVSNLLQQVVRDSETTSESAPHEARAEQRRLHVCRYARDTKS